MARDCAISERKLKREQEGVLFNIKYALNLPKDKLKNHLKKWSYQARAGMIADEIDAIEARVAKAISDRLEG